MIAPDLRGYGDSDLAPDGFYDVAAYSHRPHALVHDVLGHERCVRRRRRPRRRGPATTSRCATPASCRALCFFNTLVILRDELFEAAGIPPDDGRDDRAHGRLLRAAGPASPTRCIAELDTPERRRAWVAAMYGHRLWAAPGHFTPEDIDFMTEPFADADQLRASWGATRPRTATGRSRTCPRCSSRARCPTLVLYGPEDHVVPPLVPRPVPRWRSPSASARSSSPSAGHFLQWERPDVLNRALAHFCL